MAYPLSHTASPATIRKFSSHSKRQLRFGEKQRSSNKVTKISDDNGISSCLRKTEPSGEGLCDDREVVGIILSGCNWLIFLLQL